MKLNFFTNELQTLKIVLSLIALIYLPCLAQNEFLVNDPDFTESVERYQKRIRKDQKNLALHRKMIKYAKETDRMNVPFYIYKQSYEKHPEHPVVLYVFGYTYLIDGKKESLRSAEKYLSKAIDQNPKMASAHAALGAYYLKQGKVQEAGESIKTSIRLDPKLVPGFNGLGDYYRAKGKYEKAIKSYNYALKLDPESFEAHLGLGITSFKTQNYDTAIEKLKLAITLNSSSIEAHRFLGKCYAWSGNAEMAMKEYALAINDRDDRFTWYEPANLFLELDNSQYALKALQKALPEAGMLSNVAIDEAADILENISAKRPTDTKLRHFLSRLHLSLGNTTSAKQHLEAVKKIEPENTEVHMELGKIYEKEDQPEKATEEYQEAAKLGSADTSVLEKVADKYFDENDDEKFIEMAEKIFAINSKNASIHYKLSIIYERKHDKLKAENAAVPFTSRSVPDEIIKQYDLAVEHCKQAVKLATANFDYRLRLADLYAKEGKLKALRDYKDTIELAPKNALGYYHRARFMTNFKFGGGFLLWSPEDILNDLQKAIALDPKLTGAYSTLGKIYDRMNETEKSIEAYEKAVQLDPSAIEAQLALAEKYAEQYPQKAIKAFQGAIDAGADDVEMLKDYASLILRFDEKRKWKKAQMALKKALEMAPNDTEVLMNYGYTLFLEKRFPEAIEYYQKTLKLEPNNIRTLYNLAVAYEHARQQKEALLTWKKIFRLDPNGKYGHTASKRIKVLEGTSELEDE